MRKLIAWILAFSLLCMSFNATAYAEGNETDPAELWADSEKATLPSFTTQPQSQTLGKGATVTFTVATKSATSIRWQVDRGDGNGFMDLVEGDKWQGVQTNALSFIAVATKEAYRFRAVATNAAGETASKAVTFKIIEKPTIKTQPQSQLVPSGETVMFTVEAENADGIQWQVDRGDERGFMNLAEGEKWQGVQTNTLSFTAVAAKESYRFRAVATNAAGETESKAVKFSILTAPVITKDPVSVTVAEGQEVKLSVAASGSGLTYQWYCKGPNAEEWKKVITDGTSAAYNLTVKMAHNGYQYRCVVKNAAGNVTSLAATLTVIELPVITKQPTSEKVSVGQTVTFSVTATGTDLTYQWYCKAPNAEEWKKVTADGTSSTYSLTTKAAHNGYFYKCVVRNSGGSVTSSAVKLTVITPPAITKQPESVSVSEGQTAKFSVVASGTSPQYQWYYRTSGTTSWNAITDATSSTYSFTAKADQDGYQYRCVVKNSAGGVTSSVVTLAVTARPTIIKQPTSLKISEGQTATFSLTASGTDLTYQWYCKAPGAEEWTKITADGTGSAYSLTAKATRDGYLYKCVVRNSAGSVTSSAAKLTVITPPTITKQPSPITVAEGKTAKFSVTATGTSLTYQWYCKAPNTEEWKKITTDGTASTYSLTAKAAHDGYLYRCVVKNSAGSEISAEVMITVIIAPAIVKQPASVKVNEGQTATFSVTATGTNPTYQWYYKAPNAEDWKKIVTDGTSSTYNVTAKAGHDGYLLKCVVKNSAGSITSSIVKLNVITPPTITKQPATAKVNEGQTARFSVTASGTGLTYQWYCKAPGTEEWKKITTDGNAATYSLTAKAAHSGYQYRCVVKNSAGSITSSAAKLTVVIAPTITKQPASVKVNAGQTAKFSVTATGTDLSYQWYSRTSATADWTAIGTNGTASSYSLTAKAGHDGYQFRCVVKNSAGSATSSVVKLTVIVPPTITKQPASAKVNEGQTATFSVTASGTSPSYQWYCKAPSAEEWKKITTDGTSSTYSVTVKAAHGGYQYRCVVKNSAGSVTSSAAKLTVIVAPTITKQPASVTIAEGQTAKFSVTASGTSLTYQWYYRTSSSASWTAISTNGTSSAYSLTANAGYNGYQYKCVVANSAGSVTSSIVKLTVIVPPAITKQPASVTVAEGKTATFSVTATGTNLKYQWYCKAPGSEEWKKITTNGTSSTYSLTVKTAHNGYQLKCVVRNGAGSVTSSAAKLTVTTLPTITKQPASVTVSEGQTAKFSVTASGAGLTYQWYYRTSSSASWTIISTNGTSSTYSMTANAGNNGYQYKCVVTNSAGSVTSSVATLTVKALPTITQQPVSVTVDEGQTATFRVTASGTGLTYQWYYRISNAADWHTISSNGTSATYSLKAETKYSGYQFKCVVTNSVGSVTSSIATLTVVWDPYNLGDETYSFDNYRDSDSDGHCYGMSMTSAGYHLGLLDISIIGGNANSHLYNFGYTSTVKAPICYYQDLQGYLVTDSIVAGGTRYVNYYYNTDWDWKSVVGYVNDHEYDKKGNLQVLICTDKNGKTAGHAVNFLRYENVNGQDRIYVYDNNFPNVECYFYRDSSGNIWESPYKTYNIAIKGIALADVRTYFSLAPSYDTSRVLYVPQGAATIPGCKEYFMFGQIDGEEYAIYEIPEGMDRITIIPNKDNVTFRYMGKEYSFGKITEYTRGQLKLSSKKDSGKSTDAEFKILNVKATP